MVTAGRAAVAAIGFLARMNPPVLRALQTGDAEAWDEAFRWLWPTVFAVAQLKLQPYFPNEMNQKCRVSPEAYQDKTYEGFVAEVAPEATRAKGTLQIKVQVENPDHFLTPELTAKVDFLAD